MLEIQEIISIINLLLTEREGSAGDIGPRSWQYGPRTNIHQYGPEQVKLVSSLFYKSVDLLKYIVS